MDAAIGQMDAWLIALALALAMIACWTAGWRHGQRLPPQPGEDPGVKFTDASVALLGLLLAFTFLMALGRHDLDESNAIGDLYTCATLLKEPQRSELQTVIRNYATQLLETPYEALHGDDEQKASQSDAAAFSQMTAIVSKALDAGTPIAVNLTNSLNNVTSSNASRLAAFQERLPWSIVLLLFLSSLAPSFLIGVKQGSSKQVHPSGSFSFIVMVTLVVFITLDLNQPRRGIINVSQAPLKRLVQSMGK